MSDYQDLKKSISKLYSSSNIKSHYKQLMFMNCFNFVLFMIVEIGLWTIKFMPSTSYFKDLFSLIIIVTQVIMVFMMILALVFFLKAAFDYKYHSKSINPLNIQTREEFDKLFFHKALNELIEDFEFKSNTIIHPEDTKFKGNVIYFKYQYKGQTYNFETENYIKQFDNGERRLEIHIIQEDIIYPLLEGKIRNIVLYNY